MSKRANLYEDYYFTVEKAHDNSVDSDDYEKTSGYSIRLPHQCDAWEILGADYGDYPTDKAKAITQMELFIQRAQEALQALRELP